MNRRVCKDHGPYEAQTLYHVVAGTSQKYETPCPKCKADLHAALAKRAEKEEAEKIKSLIDRSNIPRRYRSATVRAYKTDRSQAQKIARDVCVEYLRNFDKFSPLGCSLVFSGNYGTGKTHLACAIANALLSRGISAFYTTVYDAAYAVKDTYRKSSNLTEKQVLQRFLNPGLLILDEVGVQFGTEAEKIIIYQILNGRYNEMLPTILISNLSHDEMCEYIGDRCIDRMREGGGAVVSFDWESYRK